MKDGIYSWCHDGGPGIYAAHGGGSDGGYVYRKCELKMYEVDRGKYVCLSDDGEGWGGRGGGDGCGKSPNFLLDMKGQECVECGIGKVYDN
jgi:hypothetical protein